MFSVFKHHLELLIDYKISKLFSYKLGNIDQINYLGNKQR